MKIIDDVINWFFLIYFLGLNILMVASLICVVLY